MRADESEAVNRWLERAGERCSHPPFGVSVHIDSFLPWPMERERIVAAAVDVFALALRSYPGNGTVVPTMAIPLQTEDGSRFTTHPEWRPPDDFEARLSNTEPPQLGLARREWLASKVAVSHYHELDAASFGLGRESAVFYRVIATSGTDKTAEFIADVLMEPSVAFWVAA